MRLEHQSLRQDLDAAWCPSLGTTGLSLIDRSGRNNHGTLTNMGGQDNWRASGSGLALNLDGTDDYVTLGNKPTHDVFNAACTISFWARVNAFGGVVPLMTKGTLAGNNGLTIVSFVFSGSNYVQCNFSTGSVQNDTNCTGMVAGEWVHCLFRVGGGTRQAFTNGVQTDTRTHSAVVNSSGYDLLIGRRSGTTTYFGGQLDDIRLYKRALTLSEIRLLASRRGIGLTPLPDRAAGLPRKLFVNVGSGVWAGGDHYVRTVDGWRLGIPSVDTGAGGWK
jgi:hypothetical protein